MAYTNWKTVPRNKIIPNEKTTKQFQYKVALELQVYLLENFIGSTLQKGTIQMQLTTPTGLVLFSQKVDLQIYIVNLGGPLLQLYTWQEFKEHVTTTVIGGELTGVDNPSWKYTLGGTELSEEGILIPGGGGGETDLIALIDVDWQSPIYKMKIPVGSLLKLGVTTWTGGSNRAKNFQFKFLYGVDDVNDTAYDRFGGLVYASGFKGSSTIRTGRYWSPSQKDGGQFLRDGSDPSLIMLDDGREILGLMQKEGYVEYVSWNSEWTWERVNYPDKELGYGLKPYVVWPVGVTMPMLVKTEGSTRVSIAVSGGKLRSRQITDSGISGSIIVGPADTDETYSITKNDDGVLIICDTQKMAYRSYNGGGRWDPV